MRIIAGDFGGRRLTPVGKGDEAAHLRPTTDRVRESLFNMLEGGRFGAPFDGTTVLDLFAGTGALGLEALSRGAGKVTFVDDGRVAARLIRKNISLMDCADRARLLTRSALKLPLAETQADTIFLDPPYGKDLGAKALEAAHVADWIAQGALIVWEESEAQTAPAWAECLETRRYGDSVITLLRATG